MEIPPEHIDVWAEYSPNPGVEWGCAHPNVPHHRGEDLGGVLVDHGEAGGDHELPQLGEGGLAGLAGESQGEEETEAAQTHEGGNGPPPAQVEEGEDGDGVGEELQGGADQDVDVEVQGEASRCGRNHTDFTVS